MHAQSQSIFCTCFAVNDSLTSGNIEMADCGHTALYTLADCVDSIWFYDLVTKNLRFATISYQLVAKWISVRIVHYSRGRKHVPCFYQLSYTCGSLGEREMLWEYQQVSVSTVPLF